MFFAGNRCWYSRNGQLAQGWFLAVFCDHDHNLWGIVRFVKMSQLGNFMMGSMKIGSQKVTLSGTYGSDGLPMDLEKILPENRKLLCPVPPELKEKFWKGGGHNSAGSEAFDMLEWGRSIMNPLKKSR